MKANCNINFSSLLLLFTAFISHAAAMPRVPDAASTPNGTIPGTPAPTGTTPGGPTPIGTFPGGPTIADILNLSSELLGGRLAAEGYNTTSIKNIICQADKVFSPNDMPSIEQIRQNTIQYSSWIWIYQAIGALQNDKNKLLELCLSINVGNSYLIGQNGKLAKSVICSVANGAPLPTVPQPIFGKESGRTMAVRSRDNTWPAAYVKLSDSRSKATTTILQDIDPSPPPTGPHSLSAATSLLISSLPPSSTTTTTTTTTTTLHPSLPPLEPTNLTPLALLEQERIARSEPLDAVDTSRYELDDAPPTNAASTAQTDDQEQRLHRAQISHTYLRLRHTHLSLLISHPTLAQNSWLISNSQLEGILQGYEREVVGVREEIEGVNRGRKGMQERGREEVEGLEEGWRKVVGRVVEVEVEVAGVEGKRRGFLREGVR
ncbi:MAG: hypothetical protein L6R37_000332 [Teloschistes peruensis]|nr:MAG: hypothetical protein L6R37_000332 [Teloschistes peruensis]